MIPAGQKCDRFIGIVVNEFFLLLPPSCCLHNVSAFLTSKIRWKCVYGTPIQSVETVEYLIFNHPIDDIFLIGKGGDLLQAIGIRDIWWNVMQRKWVAVGCVHSLKWNKSNKPSLHHRRSPEHNINVKRTYLWEERLITRLSCKDHHMSRLAPCGSISPPPQQHTNVNTEQETCIWTH
jgi:hypothetical protein